MILAQGSPSMMLVPVAEVIGTVFFTMTLGAGLVWLTDRLRSESQHTRTRWAGRAFIYGLLLCIICVGVGLSVAESFPTHAWRNRVRINTLTAIDAVTGRALPTDVQVRDEIDDPFIKLSWHMTNRYTVVSESNVPVTLTVISDGYDEQMVPLTDRSPGAISVRLTRQAHPLNLDGAR